MPILNILFLVGELLLLIFLPYGVGAVLTGKDRGEEFDLMGVWMAGLASIAVLIIIGLFIYMLLYYMNNCNNTIIPKIFGV